MKLMALLGLPASIMQPRYNWSYIHFIYHLPRCSTVNCELLEPCVQDSAGNNEEPLMQNGDPVEPDSSQHRGDRDPGLQSA